MNRRQFLVGSAVGASALLAGCSALPGDAGGNSLPSYHTSIPAESVGTTSTLTYLDVETLFALGYLGDETETPTATATADPTESGDDSATPLLTAPLVGSLFVTVFGLGFGLSRYGGVGERLSSQLNPETVDSPEELSMASVLFTPDGFVVEGEFDAEAYADDLPSSFSEVDSRNEFTIYEDDGENPAAIAIGSDALVLQPAGSGSGTTREAVQRILDARAGDVDRFADSSGDAEWGLRTAGSHGFVIISVGDNEVERGDRIYNPVAGTPLEDVSTELLVSGASIETTDGEVSGAAADTALTHTEDPVERSAIEDVYAESEATVSVSVSDGEDTQRVHIDAEFERESFGL